MRALPFVLVVALLPFASGCIGILGEELEESRQRAEEQDPQESTDVEVDVDVEEPAPEDAAPVVTPNPAPSPAAPSPTPPPPATPPPPVTPPPARPAPWPVEGSRVSYAATASRLGNDGGYERIVYANASWTYRDGDWTGTCTADVHERVAQAGWTHRTATRAYTAESPPHWPLFNTRSPPAAGGAVQAWYLEGCAIEHADGMVYAGTDTEAVIRDGQPVLVATHVAVAPETAGSQSFRTEWSSERGLVLAWDWTRWSGAMSSRFEGRLVQTDAPL